MITSIASIVSILGPVAVKVILALFDYFRVKKENKKKFLEAIIANEKDESALNIYRDYQKLISEDDGWK